MQLIISVALKPDAGQVRGWYTLNRTINGKRTPISNSGTTGCDSYEFVFQPAQIQGWGETAELGLDVLVTFAGATQADVKLDVIQIDPKTSAHVPRKNLDAVPAGKDPDFLFEVDTPNTLLPSPSFAVDFE